MTSDLAPAAFVAFGLAGLGYAVMCIHADDHPFGPRARRIVAALIVALVLSASVLTVSVYAAEKYDMCKDPAYYGTAWWYAWGCWMY